MIYKKGAVMRILPQWTIHLTWPKAIVLFVLLVTGAIGLKLFVSPQFLAQRIGLCAVVISVVVFIVVFRVRYDDWRKV